MKLQILGNYKNLSVSEPDEYGDVIAKYIAIADDGREIAYTEAYDISGNLRVAHDPMDDFGYPM